MWLDFKVIKSLIINLQADDEFIFAEKPHNPMINAGAILVCSLLNTLIWPERTLAEKFDLTMNYFKVNRMMTYLFRQKNGWMVRETIFFSSVCIFKFSLNEV